MPNTGAQIRDYYDEIVVRVSADEILEPTEPIMAPAARPFPGVLVAGLAAAIALIVVGTLGLWLTAPPDAEPAVPTTVLPKEPPTLPDVGLDEVPAFEALVRYELGGRDGTPALSTADVLFSYEPPDSYRRQILALDPPDMEFWRGQVGDYVASDGTFRIVTGETTEEGEVLGALVWFNWEYRCAQPAMPMETETPGRTLTAVACEDPDDPWTIVVDRDSGVVVQASGELHGDDFSIPGIGFEVISVTYEPDYGAGWFEAPLPGSPAISGEPFVFTYTETMVNEIEEGVEYNEGFLPIETHVARVTWLNEGTWRSDIISGREGSLGQGSFQIYADQTLFTYDAATNEFNEERFPEMDSSLVGDDCDETGTCTHDDIRIVCDTTPDEAVGRPATRYECAWPAPYSPETIWIDDELGYVLKSEGGDGHFEVTAIDLDPVIDPVIFEQACPTTDCVPVDSG